MTSKNKIIKDYQKNAQDTGSIEVQVALLTERINRLNEHFKAHPKDNGSKRGLLVMVGKRRKFLKYVQQHDAQTYKNMIERLGLRK